MWIDILLNSGLFYNHFRSEERQFNPIQDSFGIFYLFVIEGQ